MSRWIIGMGAAFLAIACGKEVSQRIAEPALMHTWEKECGKGEIIPLSMKTFVKYSGDDFEEVHTFYSSEDCTEPAAELRYSGTFTLREGAKESDAKPIDFDYTDAEGVALNDKGKKALEALNPCGFEKWDINAPNKFTNLKRGITCPIRSVPSKRFGIYRIENDRLIVGDGAGIKEAASQESERPTKLASESPLKISQRNL